MAGPLSNIKVLDLSRVLAGPWSTQLLSDLGADVIKVERPEFGDDTRAWGPPFLKRDDGTSSKESAYFISANRGKRSITVNISSVEGQQIIRDLVKNADVFIENYKAGDMQRYGLDFSALSKINPGLVYCSITGFGQTGPYRNRAGYDFVIQAMGGLMSVTGESDEKGGGPQKCGVPISDLMTGMYASVAIVSALYERTTSHQGQYIDMSLLDTQVAWLANQASNYLVSGDTPKRWGNAHPNLVPYQSFAASDGELILAVGNDRQYQALCHTLNADHLIDDERYATNSGRLKNRASLVDALATIFSKRTMSEWMLALENAGVPCGPVQSIPEALDDEHVRARGMILSLKHTCGASVPLIANPIKFSRSQIDYDRAPPMLGEHTAEVLKSELGWTESDVLASKQRGII